MENKTKNLNKECAKRLKQEAVMKELDQDIEQYTCKQLASHLRKLDDNDYRVIGDCVYTGDYEFECLTSNKELMISIIEHIHFEINFYI